MHHRTAAAYKAPAFILVFFMAAAPLRATTGGLQDLATVFGEISAILRSIHSLLSGIALIADIIGLGTILLMIAVIVFSAGYSAMGVPRGKPVFFAALFTADALMIIWMVGLRTPVADYFLPALKANLLVLAPMAIAHAVAKLAPRIAIRLKGRFPFLFRARRMKDRNALFVLYGTYREKADHLDHAMIRDLGGRGKEDGDMLSSESISAAAALKEILREFEKKKQ